MPVAKLSYAKLLVVGLLAVGLPALAQQRSDGLIHQWSEGTPPQWPGGLVTFGVPVVPFIVGRPAPLVQAPFNHAQGSAPRPVPNVVMGWGGLPPSGPGSAGLVVRQPTITPAGTLFGR